MDFELSEPTFTADHSTGCTFIEVTARMSASSIRFGLLTEYPDHLKRASKAYLDRMEASFNGARHAIEQSSCPVSVADWREAVNGDCRLGYWEWRAQQIAEAKAKAKPVPFVKRLADLYFHENLYCPCPTSMLYTVKNGVVDMTGLSSTKLYEVGRDFIMEKRANYLRGRDAEVELIIKKSSTDRYGIVCTIDTRVKTVQRDILTFTA